MATIEAGTDRVSLRIPPDLLAEIDRLWREHGFPNRTEFMIRAAVEYAGAHRSETDERLDELEERVQRLEASEFGQSR
jgi:metal-responsive CopG/Arc/MetJ family transcriptional regulator